MTRGRGGSGAEVSVNRRNKLKLGHLNLLSWLRAFCIPGSQMSYTQKIYL